MDQIFVSYARADKDFVDTLARDIESAAADKFDVWTDRADISGGDDWNTAISRAIRACSYFLLVLSPNSAKSTKVGQELSLADKHDKRIIPIMYQPCDTPEELELLLTRRQTIDFTQDYNEALQRLHVALGQKRQANEQPINRQPMPQPQQPPPPAFVPPQLNLFQVLPGQWMATATYPMMQVTAAIWMSLDGSFQARQTPMGWNSMGRWSINQFNQVYMQGMVTDGFNQSPFATVLRVSTFDQNQIYGLGPQGEQVVWQRVA
ncbi:MAG TPA: toll/interleukin-1 receptor domain-containing protein [Pyrinomonadaceae bacterium]|jgi:hypothetical protein|nr:toll/interleukin-1 receptor domain-containing protein [Pyrinomonadaceae bacterium]